MKGVQDFSNFAKLYIYTFIQFTSFLLKPEFCENKKSSREILKRAWFNRDFEISTRLVLNYRFFETSTLKKKLHFILLLNSSTFENILEHLNLKTSSFATSLLFIKIYQILCCSGFIRLRQLISSFCRKTG